MASGALWEDEHTAKLVEIYNLPSKPAPQLMADLLNSACETAYTVRAVLRKLQRLGILNRGPSPEEKWTEPRSNFLRELYNRDNAPSYTVMAAAVNLEFGTKYSRCAISSKISQLKLAKRALPEGRSKAPYSPGKRALKKRVPAPKPDQAKPPAPTVETITLRCVEIVPRHVSLIDLEPGDCRYPYGGDAEPITFCGHGKMAGSSYCVPHYHLTRGPGTTSERAATRGVAA